MATVIKSAAGFGNHADVLTDMQTLIDNYWGSTVQEKTFPVALWKLNQLFNTSSSRQVALKAKNISNSSLVDAEWIVFEEGMDNVVSDNRRDEFYFVFTEDDFEAIKSGVLENVQELNSVIFLGRIGKTGNTNEFVAFIFVAGVSSISTGSTQYPGATTGVRIPPQ
jgi:hypothetical protein